MTIKPPVVERAIACRFPRIEPEAFLFARKRWKPVMEEHGFTETLVKNWEIKIPAESTGGPDLAKATMALREEIQYKKDGNTILRPCQDLFSVNLIGADNTSFEQAARLAEKFIPQWLEMAHILQPQAIELVYVDVFNENHLSPFVLENGDLHLPDVFKFPFISSVRHGKFIVPISHKHTLELSKTPYVSFSVSFDVFASERKKFNAKLVQTATQRLGETDQNLCQKLKQITCDLHRIHTESFQSMLTPAMLKHCNIEVIPVSEASL